VRILVRVFTGTAILRTDNGTSSDLSHDSLRKTCRGANVSSGGQTIVSVGLGGSPFHCKTEQLTSGMLFGVRVKASPVVGGKRLASVRVPISWPRPSLGSKARIVNKRTWQPSKCRSFICCLNMVGHAPGILFSLTDSQRSFGGPFDGDHLAAASALPNSRAAAPNRLAALELLAFFLLADSQQSGPRHGLLDLPCYLAKRESTEKTAMCGTRRCQSAVGWKHLRGVLSSAETRLSPTQAIRSMSVPPVNDVTALLQAWSAGDQDALEKLAPLVYEELHRTAHRYMAREQTGHTLQTTALVNEVYLRLVKARDVNWQNRAHFFAICARMMRRILTDFARSRRYLKRGGNATRVSLDETLMEGQEAPADITALDDALKALANFDERKSRVVELRFFGGLSVEETAEVLRVSVETVHRDWKLARAWLLRRLSSETHDGT
jgi:RNA polymerase sigma-70 factor (ECF subfamily)